MTHTLAPGGHRQIMLLLAALLMLTEALWLRLRGGRGYDWRETAASTGVLAGQVVSRALTALLVAPAMLWVQRHRLFDIALDGWQPVLALLLGVEFLYYWFHRASHKVRWLWASHGVHHSSTRLNFSAAYRLGWTNALSGGWLFFAPLVWLGFSPAAVFGTFAANLAFQFLLHTETVGRLGPLEWVFNTPSQHRVHHASNTGLLDRNFGGMLIVFDRLFGTHAAEPRDQPLRYGLAGAVPSHNPLRIALGEWAALLRDMAAAGGLGRALRVALGKP